MAHLARLRVGTSGWHYDHWRGVLYPDDLPATQWLAYYAEHFDTVEINSSFYRLPSAKTLADWRDAVPARFAFAVKASRYITHMKKLKEPTASMKSFLDRIAVLGERLGPVLLQLPPRFRVNPERLSSFLDALPAKHRYAFEFRDETWMDERIYELLRQRQAAFCIYDLAGSTSPKEVTTDFVYVRLHGPSEAYRGQYGKRRLAGWMGAIAQWRRQGATVFCYFDNDERGYAARDAFRLQEMARKQRRSSA